MDFNKSDKKLEVALQKEIEDSRVDKDNEQTIQQTMTDDDEPVMVACPHCKKEFNIDDGLFDEEEEEDEQQQK